MSNQVEKQIVEEGPRNAVVRVSMVLDTNDVNLVSFIKPSDFTNNDIGMTLTGFRMDAVIFSVGQVLDVILAWNSSTPQLMLPLSRSGKIDATPDGGYVPNTALGGYGGSINIKTAGFPAGTIQVVSLLLRLVKLYRV